MQSNYDPNDPNQFYRSIIFELLRNSVPTLPKFLPDNECQLRLPRTMETQKYSPNPPIELRTPLTGFSYPSCLFPLFTFPMSWFRKLRCWGPLIFPILFKTTFLLFLNVQVACMMFDMVGYKGRYEIIAVVISILKTNMNLVLSAAWFSCIVQFVQLQLFIQEIISGALPEKKNTSSARRSEMEMDNMHECVTLQLTTSTKMSNDFPL
jgi:hypothetical protein